MAATREHLVTCGTGKMPARLPVDRTRIIPGPPPSATPLPDSAAAFRRALEHPVGMPPLGELAGKGARVTIGIQDGRQPSHPISYHPHLAARSYYTRVHADGAPGDRHAASR